MMSAADHFKEKCVVEVELVRCKCCGLMEECTLAYIDLIRETFCGRWICGLCAEAVKDEFYRSGNKYIEMEEALMAHMAFCNIFKQKCRVFESFASFSTGLLAFWSSVICVTNKIKLAIPDDQQKRLRMKG